MTFSPPNTLEPALPENVSFAPEWEQFHEQWTNLYRKVAYKVNGKERAIYPLGLEIVNDQRFFTVGDPQKYREAFRKVFNIGAVAAGATVNTPHGITNMTSFTKIEGTAVTVVPDYRPLPFSSPIALNQNIWLSVTAIDVVIVNGAGSPNITSAIVVLEYLKQ